MRRFVCGDIHGAHKALIQCLERSGFNKNEDQLIQLGDVADGWNEVYECVEELLSIKNLVAIRGNHDKWFAEWMVYGAHPSYWLQGGIGTLESYCKNTDSQFDGSGHAGYKTSLNTAVIPQSHKDFFMETQKPYYIDHMNNLFVHGGYDRTDYISNQLAMNSENFWWDRSLWDQAQSCAPGVKLKTTDEFKKIFIGHTATERKYKDLKPVESGGVWNLDQGAGWSGKLTLMNIDTEEYFQSDLVSELYTDQHGRN